VLSAAVLLVLGNPALRASALAPVERAAEGAGLCLRQVTLAGHRFASDADIYDALHLDEVRTLLGFDAGAAQARVEALPWIERASIERVLPDGIDVRVSERVPFAVWRLGEQSWLIDGAGRKLQAVPADVMPHLLRVSGAGAAREASALSAVLADFPRVARMLEFAERVSARRWTLHVSGGTSIELPDAGEAEALARLSHLFESGLGGARRIDLRVPARILVGLDGASTAEGAPAARAGRT
jgi:cell division protein FtsQ